MYKISSSEQTRHNASTFETKALLYLAGFHPDSEKMEFFIVDFYNDLTGTDRLSEEVWDLQSKSTPNQGHIRPRTNAVQIAIRYTGINNRVRGQ